ncbi:THAP domain-containing protein 2-like [Stegodyphus dumicola]|uniref:THAP domain-containing protein 2-like n=1 Tax=Stegodyphus dumicola TaxID=202533 RepID=UPI0015AA2136|nr:THAP domain-containing protein 2-like [Stegodyphus dumicola]
MVYTCCVPNCRGNYPNTEKVQMFSIPKSDSLRRKWLRAIHRQNFIPSNHSKVCEKHFVESDIERTVEHFDEKKGTSIKINLIRPRLHSCLAVQNIYQVNLQHQEKVPMIEEFELIETIYRVLLLQA